MPLAAGAGLVIGTLSLAAYSLAPDKEAFVEESGPLEWVQLAVWIASTGVALVATVLAPSRRDRIDAIWLLILSALAVARELDVQNLLNPEHGAGDLGVSFRIEWWLDSGVSPGLKAAWLSAGLVLAALILAPPLLVRAPVVRLLRAGDAPAWLFLGAIGLLGCGYALDDLVGRGAFVPESWTRLAEEVAETMGALCFLASLALTAGRPLSRRIRAIGGDAVSGRM